MPIPQIAQESIIPAERVRPQIHVVEQMGGTAFATLVWFISADGLPRGAGQSLVDYANDHPGHGVRRSPRRMRCRCRRAAAASPEPGRR